MKNRKPNIVLINCDDLGYGDLGCYGSKVNVTPAIDRMASEGILFTDFYMTSPVCSPSRGSMMTGCYPPRIGFGEFEGNLVLFPGHGVGLNKKEKTIAGVLKDADYNTMLVGKWHCGDQKEFLPTNHGFDSYYGLPYSNDMGMQPNRDYMKNPPLPLLRDDEVIQEQPDQTSLTERYVEQATRFIRDNKDAPFFLYFAHMHVHLPHYPPERFLKQSNNGEYGAAVECIDWATDAILHELRAQGIDEDTLVIFTSDNGSNKRYGGSNAPLRGRKGTTWEGGMRVPCIMHWPGQISPNRICSQIVSSIDFYKTFANLADGTVPCDRIIDGEDITDLILDKSDKSPRDTFFYYRKNDLEAVRHEEWKLHFSKSNKEVKELYNLHENISESNNLYSENPEIVDKLTRLADLCRHDIGDERLKITGKNIRKKGVVKNPDTLTHYNADHPYIIAMYDKEESG